MKHLRRILLALVLCCLAAACAFTLAACVVDKDPNPDPNPDHGPGPEPGPSEYGDEVEYAVVLQRSSGDPLAGVTVVAYDTEGALKGYAVTNDEGRAAFSLAEGSYSLQFANLPQGYSAAETYTVSATEREKTIKLRASLIQKAMPTNTTYTLGSVMYDFSFTDTEGRQSSLGALLGEKKMVLLNFWYTTCTYCLAEFPDMKAAYLDYEDDVAVVGIDPLDGTTATEAFRADEGQWGEGGLPFHMVANENRICAQLVTAFGVTGYPTTVMVDREGVVCFIASGAGTENEFRSYFEKMTAEPYEQDIYYPDEITAQKPNVEAPTSAEIEEAVNNTASGFTFSYYFVPEGEEASHEYSWPWLVGSDSDGSYLYASNSGYPSSYAMIYCDVAMSEGQVLAFDYKVSCEEIWDEFIVFIDDIMVADLSGVNTAWRTCYAYVPVRSGTYTLNFTYLKDSRTDEGDDTVYIRNVRFVDRADITGQVDVLYPCADGTIEGNRWTHYTEVELGADGYYHVGSAEGPLLLADFMNATHWSSRSAYDYYAMCGFLYDLDGDGTEEDISHRFIDFCQYANNSEVYGKIGVTEEVRSYLKALTELQGVGGHEEEWLELCYYYISYGDRAGSYEVLDPARGLTDYNAIPAVENTAAEGEEPIVNTVRKTRALMPRGIWYKFVPAVSGVYRVRSHGNYDTYGWIRDEDLEVIAENDELEFDPDDIEGTDGNFSMTLFMQEGKAYYIACDFFGVDSVGTYTFSITNLGAEGDFWMPASAGEYTWDVLRDENGDPMYDESGETLFGDYILKGAVDYVLGEDGFYHAVNEDGSEGSVIYINLDAGTTAMFQEQSIASMRDAYFFYCGNCGYAVSGNVPDRCPACDGRGSRFERHRAFELPTARRGEDGKVLTATYRQGEDVYQVPLYEKDADGKVIFVDYTDILSSYVVKAQTEYPTDEEANHRGYVAATPELVEVLMRYIVAGDFSFPGVDNAWLLLSYYYLHLGA